VWLGILVWQCKWCAQRSRHYSSDWQIVGINHCGILLSGLFDSTYYPDVVLGTSASRKYAVIGLVLVITCVSVYI